jgi:hypothetical protein
MKAQQIKQEKAEFAVLQMSGDLVSLDPPQSLMLIGKQLLIRRA